MKKPMLDRRTLLALGTTGGALLLGCSGSEGENEDGSSSGGSSSPGTGGRQGGGGSSSSPDGGGAGETQGGSGGSGGSDGAGGSDGTGGETAGDDVCKPAVTQLEGPYPQNCPERSNLHLYGHDAISLKFLGKVLDENCQPIADAIVLIWHSCPSSSGATAMPSSQNTIDPSYSSAVYDVGTGDMVGKKTPDGQTVPTGHKMYYGWVRTNERGEFAFDTIRPGYYWDNLAFPNRYRCTHIHAKVFVGDTQVLITQLYFPDDPFNESDPLYADCKAKGDCLLRLSGSTAVFNFQV